ncbi:HpcH/HpaI aldolase/citrate lyase family protein [Paraburkholderia fynbosensis]|uniref:L-malyl-CoA/beta-methylmalyl-CoA lyase n=1 Tax=Paraburkholderia fynbosensis TaxID=1200993 RepID=A0A6J5H0W6_9BURK|nr:CoA ester lyase [Paraburkholderia fynbosensis]CAB3809710.1 L-malyl-CoA/beta-methylmalyl-CoA lyase [Paraburkholderia fynbosensis]
MSKDSWGIYQRPEGTEPWYTRLRRSTLIVPANVPRFVESAKRSKADVIMLDLEDSIPVAQKAAARETLAKSIDALKKVIPEVVVRVNREFDVCLADIEAAVSAGCDGIRFPKVQNGGELLFLDRFLTHLEGRYGRAIGSTELGTSIETPGALFKLEEIVNSTDRLGNLSFSTEDMCAELGVSPTHEGFERLIGNALVVLAAADRKILATGVLGYISNYKDLETYEIAARRGAAFGFQGAGAIHPSQVEILNRVFMPSEDQVAEAWKVIAALEVDPTRGSASVDGVMVDVASVKRARRVLTRSEMAAAREAAVKSDGI